MRGQQDPHWEVQDMFCEKQIQRLHHAEAAAHYENEATRSNVVRRLTDRMVARKDGYKCTIASIWQEIARAHEDINGGLGVRIFGSRSKIADEPGGGRATSWSSRLLRSRFFSLDLPIWTIVCSSISTLARNSSF